MKLAALTMGTRFTAFKRMRRRRHSTYNVKGIGSSEQVAHLNVILWVDASVHDDAVWPHTGVCGQRVEKAEVGAAASVWAVFLQR